MATNDEQRFLVDEIADSIRNVNDGVQELSDKSAEFVAAGENSVKQAKLLKEKNKDSQSMQKNIFATTLCVTLALSVVSIIVYCIKGSFSKAENIWIYVASAGLGGVIGGLITFDTTGLDFALTAMFVVLFMQQWKQKENRPACVIGVAITLLCRVIFGTSMFLVPALLGMLLIFFFNQPIIPIQVTDAQCCK